MRYVLTGLVLTFFAFTVSAASITYGPYSGAPSATSVTISWLSLDALAARVEYDRTAAYETTGTLSQATADLAPEETALSQPPPSHVALTGLDPDTAYVYRVVLIDEQGEVASPIGHFVTAPPSGEPVTFAVLADTQWQWEGVNRLAAVADAIAADDAPFDFILHAGDLVESPSTSYWEHWFASFEPMLLRAPFISVLGNHEDSHRSYYQNFALPPGGGRQDKRWWALHWGDVVIVGLDTVSLRVADYVAEQEWARLHLSGPEPHKFVIFHYPVFSSDAYHGDGYSYDVIFHPIFVETGVDIVFNGHAHNYERIERDGVTYLVVGGGGAVPRALAETRVEGSKVAIEGYNFYARVNTSDRGIDVDIVSVAEASDDAFTLTDGHLLDAFSLPSRKPLLDKDNLGALLLALLGAAVAGFLIVRGLHR